MSRKLHTTPRKINSRIRAFLKKAGFDSAPQYFELTEVDFPVFSGYCLDNCERASNEFSWAIAFGWIIWEAPYRNFIEAEFHAVVRTEQGLIDVTPRVDGEKKILFVEDDKRVAVRQKSGDWLTWRNIQMQNGVLYSTKQTLARGLKSNTLVGI